MPVPTDKNHGWLGHYAGFASRLMALLIDVAIISLTISAVSLIIASIPSVVQRAALFDITLFGSFLPFLEMIPPVPTEIIALIIPAFVIIYHVFFLATAGRTPGKAFMGLRVLTTSGNRLSTLRAIIRVAGYPLSGLPFFAGFLWVFIDERRQSLHDKLAGTLVVYGWTARPDERFLMRQIQRLSSTAKQK